jgi:hypothetical protein
MIYLIREYREGGMKPFGYTKNKQDAIDYCKKHTECDYDELEEILNEYNESYGK